jgi:hypothetical protein
MAAPDDDPVAVLHHWTDAGAVWRVIHQAGKAVTVGLYQCDGGEEVDRITSTDPRLMQYLAGRTSSEE